MVRTSLQHLRALVARLIAWLIFRGPVVVGRGRGRFIFDPRTGDVMPVIAGGAPDDDDEDDDSDGDDDDDDGDDSDDDKKKAGDDDDKTDWKAMARKHERREKALKAERDELAGKLKEREDAKKSEHEKALEAARKEAREEALTESEKERRSDRLEVAVTRIAARGVKLGDDDKVTKFADPEDALVFIERAIAKGDIAGDDIFDDKHKVDSDAVTDELVALLKRKPRLAAGATNDDEPAGDVDAGRGGRRKDPDDMSVEDHLKKVQKRT
jgi:hypothetical protein